jgi:hypothetical protein
LLVTTSKTDERAFKTAVRNGHDFPIRIAIEDQLPVSENEEIQVEMLSSTTPPTASNLRDRRGVLEWAFEAKAGEVRDINFAWRIRWPKDKNVVMTPSGLHWRLSSPSLRSYGERAGVRGSLRGAMRAGTEIRGLSVDHERLWILDRSIWSAIVRKVME